MSEGLGTRAQEVQDEIGWADMDNPHEFGRAVLQLARHVTVLSAELDRLRARGPDDPDDPPAPDEPATGRQREEQ